MERCSPKGGARNLSSFSVLRLILSCTLPVPTCSCWISVRKWRKTYSMNRTSHSDSSATNPTTLSGKQAGYVRIAVSAIFAAMVIANVFTGHNRLCANPTSLYVCL